MTLLKIIKNFVFNYLRKLNLEAKMSISFFKIFPLIFCFHHFNEDYHVMLGQNWISIKCVMICLTKYWLKYGIINIDFITSRPCQEQQSMKTSHDLPVINRINRFFLKTFKYSYWVIHQWKMLNNIFKQKTNN